MEFFKNTPQINFLKIPYFIISASSVVLLSAIIITSLYGLRWGLDFTGGLQLQLESKQPTSLTTIQEQLKSAQLSNLYVQRYGRTNNFLVTLSEISQENEAEFIQTVLKALPQTTVRQSTIIRPQAGHKTLQKALIALISALVGLFSYISIRFNYRLAIGAIIALIHEPIIILGMFSLAQLELNFITFAAILTVIGYALNNIIVIFDRIRENCVCLNNHTIFQIVNQSLNEMLARTTISSGLTFTMVLILYIFGGSLLHSFALALAVGILVGGYSSIYVATNLAVLLGLAPEHVRALKK